MNTADDLIYRWTTQRDVDEIRRQTNDRQLVADYVSHARERKRGERRKNRTRTRDFFVAVLVSALGVAMVFGLILGWFSGQAK